MDNDIREDGTERQNSQSWLGQPMVSLRQAVAMSTGLMSIIGNDAQAQTPNFVNEPANSPKVSSVVADQQAILDMMPANSSARDSVKAAIKSFADGGSTEELTKLFIWASAIQNSPTAPPAAKTKAQNIINILTGVVENSHHAEIDPDDKPPVWGWSPAQKAIIEEETKRRTDTKKENDRIMQVASWKVSVGAGGKITTKKSKEGLQFNLDENSTTGRIELSPVLPPWSYTMELGMEPLWSTIIAWKKNSVTGTNDRIELKAWNHSITIGENDSSTLGIPLTKQLAQVKLTKLVFTRVRKDNKQLAEKVN